MREGIGLDWAFCIHDKMHGVIFLFRVRDKNKKKNSEFSYLGSLIKFFRTITTQHPAGPKFFPPLAKITPYLLISTGRDKRVEVKSPKRLVHRI